MCFILFDIHIMVKRYLPAQKFHAEASSRSQAILTLLYLAESGQDFGKKGDAGGEFRIPDGSLLSEEDIY